jgi:hypothetical protein
MRARTLALGARPTTVIVGRPPEPHAHHAVPAGAVPEQLGADPARGLSEDDAAARLREVGFNELERGESVSP